MLCLSHWVDYTACNVQRPLDNIPTQHQHNLLGALMWHSIAAFLQQRRAHCTHVIQQMFVQVISECMFNAVTQAEPLDSSISSWLSRGTKQPTINNANTSSNASHQHDALDITLQTGEDSSRSSQWHCTRREMSTPSTSTPTLSVDQTAWNKKSCRQHAERPHWAEIQPCQQQQRSMQATAVTCHIQLCTVESTFPAQSA